MALIFAAAGFKLISSGCPGYPLQSFWEAQKGFPLLSRSPSAASHFSTHHQSFFCHHLVMAGQAPTEAPGVLLYNFVGEGLGVRCIFVQCSGTPVTAWISWVNWRSREALMHLKYMLPTCIASTQKSRCNGVTRFPFLLSPQPLATCVAPNAPAG